MNIIRIYSLLCAGAFLCATHTFAGGTAHVARTEYDFYQRFKQHISTNYGVRFDADYRLRHDYRQNNQDLAYWKNDEVSVLRQRTRAGVGFKPLYWLVHDHSNRLVRSLSRIEVYTRLAHEYDVHINRKSRVLFGSVLFDQLYLDVPRPLDVPFSLRVGRQDWFYGEGFIISDGTPGDGSRTHFFDGARLRWHVDDMLREWINIDSIPYSEWPLPATYIDLLFAYNRNENPLIINKRGGKYADIINDRRELLFGPYLVSELWNKRTGDDRWDWFNFLQLEMYYIFKREKAYHSSDPFTLDFNRDASIHTFGSRLSGIIHDNDYHTLSFGTEWAGQLGRYGKYQSGVRERTLLSYTGPYAFNESPATRHRGSYPLYYADGAVPIRAWGGYAWVEDHIKRIPFTTQRMPLQPRIKFLAGTLSGDDGYSGSRTDTGWRPPFSRTDTLFGLDAKILGKLMELEGGENWWSNLQMYYAGITVEPFDPVPYIASPESRLDRIYNTSLDSLKNLSYTFGYGLLYAQHTPYSERFEMGTGRLRGHLLSSGFTWDVTSYLSFNLGSELFFPGTYYARSSVEPAEYITGGHDWIVDNKYEYLREERYRRRTPGYRDPAFFLRLECILRF